MLRYMRDWAEDYVQISKVNAIAHIKRGREVYVGSSACMDLASIKIEPCSEESGEVETFVEMKVEAWEFLFSGRARFFIENW